MFWEGLIVVDLRIFTVNQFSTFLIPLQPECNIYVYLLINYADLDYDKLQKRMVMSGFIVLQLWMNPKLKAWISVWRIALVISLRPKDQF